MIVLADWQDIWGWTDAEGDGHEYIIQGMKSGTYVYTTSNLDR